MGDIGSDYVDDERARRREERRRRRAEEKEQEEQELAASKQNVAKVTSYRSTGPEIEVQFELSNDQSSEEETSVGSSKSNLLKKGPSKMSREPSEDVQELNEAEQKAEAIRVKREREQEERYKEKMEERRLTREKSEQELLELEERKERRRLKQEAEERRLKQEEEERQAREAEDAKKLREEIQKRRQEAEERRRNIQNSLSYIQPKYSIGDESVLQAEKRKCMSPEELAEDKKRHLEECVPPLNISASTGVEKLKELALNLQAKLIELYEANFDLMKRKQRQEYDMNELNSRIADLSNVATPKKPIVLTVDTGHVSKIKEKGFFVEEKAVRRSFLQERNEGIAASGGVQGRLSMFQTKVALGEDQPDVKRSGRSSWKAPEYDKCCVCNKNVYTREQLEVSKKLYHKQCFKCEFCKKVTSLSNYALFDGKVYCKPHQRKVERESLQKGIDARH